ncbi:MAG: helix-turn-helix transcriptional regulator [bacterium]
MGRTRQTEIELTARQREVLRLVARGHTNTEIAETLGLSLAGAKWHVSELLVKFNVDSREELAESYFEARQLTARLGRWWSSALGALSIKPVALAAVGVAASMAATGVVVAVVLSGHGPGNGQFDDAAAHPTSLSVALTPTPNATGEESLILGGPDSAWTPSEALARAEQAARDELARNPNATIVPGTFRLIFGRWLRQAIGVPAGDPDGDFNWSPQDGIPTNVWLFSWEIPGSTMSDYSGQLTFGVTVIVKDGGDGKVLADYTTFGKPTGVDGLTGHTSGFRSRRRDDEMEKYRADRAQAGPALVFGWYNDVVNGGARLETYPAGGGYWCVRGRDSVGGGNGEWCEPDDDPRRAALNANLSTTFSATGEMGEATLFVDSTVRITSLKALPGDGRELTFATYAAPAQSGIDRRFAWITIGKLVGGYTLIGYDAAGNEVARAASVAPGPPPPPSASPGP